jgi:putative transcriptional regulator
MAMIRMRLDPVRPSMLSSEDAVRLAQMSPEEIEQNARTDADNQPSSEEELLRGETGRRIRTLRGRLNLTQSAFAQHYQINIGRLRDLEQGRTTPDSAMLAYIKVIEKEPAAVDRALAC